MGNSDVYVFFSEDFLVIFLEFFSTTNLYRSVVVVVVDFGVRGVVWFRV